MDVQRKGGKKHRKHGRSERQRAGARGNHPNPKVNSSRFPAFGLGKGIFLSQPIKALER